MISKNLLSALEKSGFTYHDDKDSSKTHAYAVYGGYLTTVYETAGKKVVYFNFKFSENEENDIKRYDMSESFSSNMEEFLVTDYSLGEDGMRVVSSANVPTFLKLIDNCVELLSENGIRGVEYCSVCSNKFGAKLPKKVTRNNENHIMCEHCAIAAIEENDRRNSESKGEQKGSVGAGFIGALLGGLLGVFLYFVLYYWLSPALSGNGLGEIRYIFCVAGFILAFFVYAGYRIFCKKVSVGGYVIIAAISLIFTAIGQYIGSVFGYLATNNFSLNALNNKAFWLVHLRNKIPADVTEIAGQPVVDQSAVFFKLLLFSVLFAAVGTAIFLLTLHDKALAKKETLDVETISLNS